MGVQDDRPDTPREEPSTHGSSGGAENTPAADSRLFRTVVKVLLTVILVLVLLRLFVFAPYGIPTGSMLPAIMQGDALLVSKLPYVIRTPDRIPFTSVGVPHLSIRGLGELERGEVIVFDPVHPGGTEGGPLVKRAAALPGDTVRWVEGDFQVNGVTASKLDVGSRRGPLDEWIGEERKRVYPLFGRGRPVIVPYEGFQLQLNERTVEEWRDAIALDGSTAEYRNRIAFIDGEPSLYYRFRNDYFIALGDNASASYDSRYFGFVPYDNLIGQVLFVYWSRDPASGEIRWDRVGEGVH